MEVFLFIILAVLVVGFVAVFLLLKNQQKEKVPDNSMIMLQNQLNDLSRVLDSKLGQVAQESRHTVSEVSRAMQQQFGESQKAIIEMTKNLARVEVATNQTLTMNEQIKKLNDTLTNPKQRG